MKRNSDKKFADMAKSIGTTVDPALAPLAGAVLSAITDGDPSQPNSPSIVQNTVAALVGDWMGEWRTRRLLAFVSRTGEIAEANGIDPTKLHHLPNGERYKILDCATRSDDPVLGDMWASLLLSDISDDDNRDRLIRLLENMTGDDARLLSFIQISQPLGIAIENALSVLSEIRSDGYAGQERSRWYSGKPDSELPSREDFELSIKDAQEVVDKKSKPLKDLETELFSKGEMYTARDMLLRAGLIQRRSIDIPGTSDFESSHTVLTSNDYRGGHNDWEDVRTCDPEAIGTAIEELHNLIAEHTGYSRTDIDPPELVQINNRFNVCPWTLTPLGTSLYEACSLRSAP